MMEPIEIEAQERIRPGPRPYLRRANMNKLQKMRAYRAEKGEDRKASIAVLDMETDPFDDGKSPILPFVCELYSDKFSPIIIWELDHERFAEKVVAAIESLPGRFTIYAHNGGKFDFMYFVYKLRGAVKFKGRAIMSAAIGNHELRDSLHILPEKLAAWKKDNFDYSKLARKNRTKFRSEILAYLHSDCVYLFDIVKSFITEFGFKISIGQAAFSELKKSYKVSHVSEQTDEFTRRYFFGGRVECLAGRGLFISNPGQTPYSMYDVNSMYPFAMANFSHPVGNEYNWRRGNPSKDTIFLDVECKNYGALVQRAADAETSQTPWGQRGHFFTTIWEFDTALKYDLIDDIKILGVVDNVERSDFSKFIVPMYDRRQAVKHSMRVLKSTHPDDYYLMQEYEELKKKDLFLKYLLNNSFGKFAQNPRKFKEFYYTDIDECPPDEWMRFLEGCDDETIHKYSMPVERKSNTSVWCKPTERRKFNNVGTAASITGAARSVLLQAMQGAMDAIYCDTDCLIAKSISGIEIDPSKLGAWDLEETYDEVIIAGKKLYAAKVQGFTDEHERRIKSRCKGAPLVGASTDQRLKNNQTWQNYLDLLGEKTLSMTNKTPTFDRTGRQYFMTRRIRATAPILIKPRIRDIKKYGNATSI